MFIPCVGWIIMNCNLSHSTKASSSVAQLPARCSTLPPIHEEARGNNKVIMAAVCLCVPTTTRQLAVVIPSAACLPWLDTPQQTSRALESGPRKEGLSIAAFHPWSLGLREIHQPRWNDGVSKEHIHSGDESMEPVPTWSCFTRWKRSVNVAHVVHCFSLVIKKKEQNHLQKKEEKFCSKFNTLRIKTLDEGHCSYRLHFFHSFNRT